MKAMILAAGLGTRLKPLTDDRPKALVTVAGRTLLQITLDRLRSFGVLEVIVNTHHHADMILEYLAANQNFGMTIEISREPVLLDTGGGLKNAAWFFQDSGQSIGEPFILHNVDVISTIDLVGMVRFHKEQSALATLAVQNRETSRYLVFDNHGQLCGRSSTRPAKAEQSVEKLNQQEASEGFVSGHDFSRAANPAISTWASAPEGTSPRTPSQPAHPLAISGIHVISPRIFAKMAENGAFSIIDAYLHLAAQGERILAYRADDCYWRDLGRPQSLTEAAHDLEAGKWAKTNKL